MPVVFLVHLYGVYIWVDVVYQDFSLLSLSVISYKASKHWLKREAISLGQQNEDKQMLPKMFKLM